MSLWKPDLSDIESYYDRAKFKLAWRLSLMFTLVFFALSAIFFTINFTAHVFYTIVFLLSVFTLFYLKKSRNYVFIFWMFSIAATILALLAMNIVKTLHYPDVVWCFAIIIFAFIGLGRKIGLIFIGIHTVGLCFFMFYTLNRHMNYLHPQVGLELISLTTELLFAMLVICYLLSEYLRLQQYAEQELLILNAELESRNKLVLAKSEENEVLVKEIHHRVKNNLQIIISLLRMQMNEVSTEESKKHFSDAINRVLTMSLIHQKLYQENKLATINPQNYINNLAEELLSMSNHTDDVRIEIHSNLEKVGLKTIVPLGLLLNELLSNSIKHAFQDINVGRIVIHLDAEGETNIRFTYSDNGAWKAKCPKSSTGFGTELIETLTQQLEGSYIRTESTYDFLLTNLDN